eukprot:548107_1
MMLSFGLLLVYGACCIHAIALEGHTPSDHSHHTLKQIHQCSSHHHTIIKDVNLFEQQTPYKNHPYSQSHAPHEHNEATQRRSLLSPSQVSPIRISAYYDPITFSARLSAANQTYVKQSIGAIADYYRNAVSVVPVDGPLHFDRWCSSVWPPTPVGQQCSEYIAATCGDIVLPSSHLSEQYAFDGAGTRIMYPSGLGIADTDLVLYVTANESSAYCTPGTLAHAGPCFVDQYGRPTAGTMNICSDFWVRPTWHEDTEVLLHEMTHITILSDALWSFFKDGSGNTIPLNEVLDATVSPNEIITPNLISKVKEHFNCDTATGLALDYGSAHWNERYVFSELMNPTQFSTQTYYTEFTLAFLEDSGWYLVNYEYAEPFAFGKNAGCGFLTGDCINKLTHDSNFPSYYCESSGDHGCNADHSAPSYCYYYNYASIPSEYQYFAVDTEGGSAHSDYCPWRTPYSDSTVCWDTTSTAPLFLAEVYDAKSRCSHVTNTNTSAIYSLCFDHTCNGWDGTQYTSVDIKVRDTETLSCTRTETSTAKAVPSIPELELKCPDVDTVCGTISNYGACYWGYYSDAEGNCVCSPGFTGTDCNSVNDGIDVDVTYPVSKAPTPAPSVEPEVCFQDWNAVDPAWNGAWTKIGEYYGLGVYSNGNFDIYFHAPGAKWLLSFNGDWSGYTCSCEVSLYTDVIGDCSTNWYCLNPSFVSIPSAKTYYGTCTNPAPTTKTPTASPSAQPTLMPTQSPTKYPTPLYSYDPSSTPTRTPSVPPSKVPSVSPSKDPTVSPSTNPTASPSKYPTNSPNTKSPSASPTVVPSQNPSVTPSQDPSATPSMNPSVSPSHDPSTLPSNDPTVPPSNNPTNAPNTKTPTVPGQTHNPSASPTVFPSSNPSASPSQDPSVSPSQDPSSSPNTKSPTIPGQTYDPSATPTGFPTKSPTEWMPCIASTELFHGDGHIQIQIDSEQRKMQITMTGPSDKWFGVGFGSTTMEGTYAIIVNGQEVTHRILGNHMAGQIVVPPGDVENTAIEVSSKTVVSVVRHWNMSGYDFSDFFEGKMCDNGLPIIWAIGNGVMFVEHGQKDNALSLRSCICTEMPTQSPSRNEIETDDPTHKPTSSPLHVANKACCIALWFQMLFVCFLCITFV